MNAPLLTVKWLNVPLFFSLLSKCWISFFFPLAQAGLPGFCFANWQNFQWNIIFWTPYFYVYIWSYPPETYTVTNTYPCPDWCNINRCCSNYGQSFSFGRLSLGNYFRNYNWGIWGNLNMKRMFLGYVEYDCMSKVKVMRKLAKEIYPPHLGYIRQTCD